jgi:cobalamin-dependent methionine synthase I
MGTKLFKNTKPEHYFKLIDGSELKNVLDLASALPRMSEDVFYSHANQGKNDFSNWVRDIYEDHELADGLSKSQTPQQTELTVLRHLLYQKKK